MHWMWAWVLWALSGIAYAGGAQEQFETDQRIARYCFMAGASAPLLLATGALVSESSPAAAAVLGGTGVVVSAVSLPLLGRRAMLAGDHLELTAGKGAIALFFGIGTTLSGAYYVLIDQSTVGGLSYLTFTAASLTLGGLQLRENRFVSDMRTDPRAGSLYLSPTPRGLALSGTF